MPKRQGITSSKFYNQLRNGDDFSLNPLEFTTNLVALAGEKIKAVFDIAVSWDFDTTINSSNPSVKDTWTTDATTITNTISDAFLDSAFEVGQVFDYFQGGTYQFTGQISSITEFTITFSTLGGSAPIGTTTDAQIRATGADNPLYSLVWDFGLLQNSEPFNNLSKVSDNPQRYQASGIGAGTSPSRSTTPVTMSPVGAYADWITGSITAAFVSESAYEQVFRIEHEFTVVPFSQSADDFALGLKPSVLQTDGLKYAPDFDFKDTLTSPKSFPAQGKQLGGFVQWYDESLVPGEYSKVSVVYEDADTLDPVLGIQDAERTKITVTIAKASSAFAAGQRAGLLVSMITQSEAEFKNTTTDLAANFAFDSLYNNEGAAISTGTGIIKSLQCSLSGDDLVLTAETEYTLAEGQQVSEHDFLLSVIVGDVSQPVTTPDRTNVLIDAIPFQDINVIPLLCTYSTTLFYEHNKTYAAGTGASSLQSWNEDGILAEIPFALDLSRDAVIERLTVKLSAYNTVTNTGFELDTYRFETASATVSGGVQQINIDNNRGYNLNNPSDQFNWAKITTGSKVGDIQNYVCLLGQKISWQDWVQNLNADTVFFNASKPNDNLNDKSSNYSGLNDYEIRFEIIAKVTGTNTLGFAVSGEAETTSGNINVNDYDLDGNPTPIWSVVIQTLDPDNLTDLGGEIYGHKNTLMRCVWTDSTGPVTTTTAQYVIHRLEQFNDAGYQIWELSTINTNPRGNPLQSTDGSGFITLSIDSGNLVSECLINPENLNNEKGTRYNLSCRIKK